MTKFLSTAKLRVFRVLCAHDVDVRTVGFAVSFRSCRAIQGGFLLLAMLCSYLVNDTWSLPSLSRSTVATFIRAISRFVELPRAFSKVSQNDVHFNIRFDFGSSHSETFLCNSR